MSDDRLYQHIGSAGPLLPPYLPNPAIPTEAELRAGTAMPDLHPVREHVRHLDQAGELIKARVYRTPADDDFGPCWHWRCDTCAEQGNGCAHPVIHWPGSWRAAMCVGFRHIHLEHPRPMPPGVTRHTTMAHRTRCDVSSPGSLQLAISRAVIAGDMGDPSDPVAKEFAREILALKPNGYER